MLLEHVEAEQEVDAHVFEHLQRALDDAVVGELELRGVDAAEDLAGADADSGACEARVDVFGESDLFAEVFGDDGALGPAVDEGLELDFVDLHLDVEHRGRDERLGQVVVGVLAAHQWLLLLVEPLLLDPLFDLLLVLRVEGVCLQPLLLHYLLHLLLALLRVPLHQHLRRHVYVVVQKRLR